MGVPEAKVRAVEGKVPAVEGKVPAVEAKVPAVEGKVPAVEAKVPAVEAKVPEGNPQAAPAVCKFCRTKLASRWGPKGIRASAGSVPTKSRFLGMSSSMAGVSRSSWNDLRIS